MISKKVTVICDNIRSLYNVGAIFRTSDGVGIVKKIYLTGMTGYPKQNDPLWHQTKKIAKTALGSEKNIPWSHKKDSIELVRLLKEKKNYIYVLENKLPNIKTYLYHKVKYKFPLVLILGHEVRGVKPEIINLADKIISIPMRGKKESLNVEAAYAIAIYEISKQA
jgi:23S rRNA (guanosine2251-2'-O)-methyltransferase